MWDHPEASILSRNETGTEIHFKSDFRGNEDESAETKEHINLPAMSIKEDIKQEPLDQDSFSNSSTESEPEEKSTTAQPETLSQHYEEISIKSFTSNFVKEDPMNDITTIYKENVLNFEKQKYHQQIFDNIVGDLNQIKMADIENKYIDHIRQAAKLEVFNCSSCEYQTMQKSNIRLHLAIIHKTDMESNMLKCLKCTYTCKLAKFMQNHVSSHQDEEPDFENDNNYSYDDNEDVASEEKSKKTRNLAHRFSKCDFKSNKKVELKKHVSLSHREKNKMWCDLCTFETEDKETLIAHKQTHKCPDNVKKYSCYRCQYESYSKDSLKKHLLKLHDIVTKYYSIKILKCEFCDYKTDLIESMRVHALSHKSADEIQWFQCDLCDFKTKFRSSYTIHLIRHKNPEEIVKKFMCEFCSFKFRFKGTLKRHLLTHQSSDKITQWFKCSDCDYKGKTRSGLRVHLTVHKGPSEMKMHVCDICGLHNRRKWNHEMHMLTHKNAEDVEMFKCTFCNYKTKFKNGLRIHLKRGSHRCGIEKGVSLGVVLSSKGERSKETKLTQTFKCPECDYRTKYKGGLKHHINTHKDPSEISMFKCNSCTVQFRRKENLTVHLLLHKSSDEVEMITCSLCSYQTKFRAYMIAHLKKRHKIVARKDEYKKYSISSNSHVNSKE